MSTQKNGQGVLYTRTQVLRGKKQMTMIGMPTPRSSFIIYHSYKQQGFSAFSSCNANLDATITYSAQLSEEPTTLRTCGNNLFASLVHLKE